MENLLLDGILETLDKIKKIVEKAVEINELLTY